MTEFTDGSNTQTKPSLANRFWDKILGSERPHPGSPKIARSTALGQIGEKTVATGLAIALGFTLAGCNEFGEITGQSALLYEYPDGKRIKVVPSYSDGVHRISFSYQDIEPVIYPFNPDKPIKRRLGDILDPNMYAISASNFIPDGHIELDLNLSGAENHQTGTDASTTTIDINDKSKNYNAAYVAVSPQDKLSGKSAPNIDTENGVAKGLVIIQYTQPDEYGRPGLHIIGFIRDPRLVVTGDVVGKFGNPKVVDR